MRRRLKKAYRRLFRRAKLLKPKEVRASSIATRWFVNSFVVVALILLVLTVSVFFMLRQYYYGTVTQILQSEANTAAGILSRHNDSRNSIDENEIRRFVEEFDKKNLMELMALGESGEILLTSSGFKPPREQNFPDFMQASQSERGTGNHIGRLKQSGERYMAVTVMLPVSSDLQESGYSAVRLVTSLQAVDNQIYTFTLFIGVFSLATLLLLLLLGLYFIRSIVSPLRQIGNTAKRLADGDFSVRITRTGHKEHDDEIGELCRIINHMADELEVSEQMKNDFISSVSHELRTPLTAIKGWSETVLELRDDEMTEKGMKVITTETDRLTEMVEELLDFSRIQGGQLSLQMTDLDIVEELSSAVMVYAERANREGITLVLNHEGLTPKRAKGVVQPMKIHGDKHRIRQVFLNIIDNAIKYSDEGMVVRIGAAVKRVKGARAIVISVNDTGCGIAKSDIPKVKMKFYKSNNTRRGSGIGLAVADEIIALHSGELVIKSELGKGTTVDITIPLI
ncbi:MAG: HAMP domain-containing histidine kinase [Oscillospiraceae bacterium]|nr:HAMP domain-containing histidine kinase [Oscillospiraceae bacterium]